MTRMDSEVGIRAAAERLGVGIPALYRLVAEGQVAAYGAGRTIRFRSEDIDALAASGRPDNDHGMGPASDGSSPKAPEDAGAVVPVQIWSRPSTHIPPIGRPPGSAELALLARRGIGIAEAAARIGADPARAEARWRLHGVPNRWLRALRQLAGEAEATPGGSGAG